MAHELHEVCRAAWSRPMPVMDSTFCHRTRFSHPTGRYSGRFSLASNPQNVTVRSSFGGQASRTVDLK